MGGKRSFFIKDLALYRWRNLLPRTVSAEQRRTLFAEGIEALGHAQEAAHLPGLFRDILRNAFLKFRDGRILTPFPHRGERLRLARLPLLERATDWGR